VVAGFPFVLTDCLIELAAVIIQARDRQTLQASQPRYSDLAIEASLKSGLVFDLPLRQRLCAFLKRTLTDWFLWQSVDEENGLILMSGRTGVWSRTRALCRPRTFSYCS
jgi:hypothetical protein